MEELETKLAKVLDVYKGCLADQVIQDVFNFEKKSYYIYIFFTWKQNVYVHYLQNFIGLMWAISLKISWKDLDICNTCVPLFFVFFTLFFAFDIF